MYLILFLGDTIHLSDIDMIDGTPVLDIKPYIPEYDSPHTRAVMDSESYDSNPTTEKESNVLSLYEASETDVGPKHKRTDDDMGKLFSKDTTEAKGNAQLFVSTDLYSVLEEVKAYVSQGDASLSKVQVSSSPENKPPESKVDQPCYGEEAYSTIADWIREPPVVSLDVRFTPHAERELAEFLPAHLSGGSSVMLFREWRLQRVSFLSPEEGGVVVNGGIFWIIKKMCLSHRRP